MGGQMQQANAAATALYDNPSGGVLYNAGPANDAGDAVMARWLQSTGLQHLASPTASSNSMPILMQGYGAQSAEEKQRLYKLMRNLNFNGESGSEPYNLNAQGTMMDGLYSPEFRGEFGAGLLDLHSMDDSELLSDHVMSEPIEQSSFMLGPVKPHDDGISSISQKELGATDADISSSQPFNGNVVVPLKETNVAKIKVVVRKRPLNKKETARKEDDIVSVSGNSLTVHEPKLKVDLTAYVEKHEFCFDAVLGEDVKNDQVYRTTVEPIIPIIFQRTKATCFAYGQTGSGKTFTMKPLPLRAAEDLVRLLHQPIYRDQKFKLWLSYFEIYGGKLFDLLSERKKLCMREDGRQQVCIVGLQEFEVLDVQIVREYIEKGNAARSTGSTGANEESSRSHAILQLVVKKHNEVKDNRRKVDANDAKNGKLVGKISFIDLAGSERGADTTDNDRQTRIEGAEINKSLLALKECIRALDNDQIHIPFRGSKLTEVLRDSFVGNSRTVMISCISPNAGSCEHTLNTLRYADRVKSLSRSGNAKKDQVSSSIPLPISKESSAASLMPISFDVEDVQEPYQESKGIESNSKNGEECFFHKPGADYEKQPSSIPPPFSLNARDASVGASSSVSKETKTAGTSVSCTNQKIHPSSHNQNSVGKEERVQNLSPPRRKISSRDETTEKLGNWLKNEGSCGFDPSAACFRSKWENSSSTNNATSKNSKLEISLNGGNMDELLEEEEALMAAHRKEIEDTMEIVREEMKLLAEVDRPGSLIDNYVTQLSFVLSRKAAGLVSLQARLARFQHRLKEQEILNRKRVLN